MGRPLNKKYFGNRNTGSPSTTADNGLGGQGIASAAIATPGSYTARPTFIFTAPQVANGVTATGTITSEVLSAAVSGTQTGVYVVGDLITISTAGGSAIAYVATLSSDAVATVNFTGTGASRGDFTSLGSVTTSGGSGTGLILTPTYRAKTVVITDQGSGYTAAPTASATQSVTIDSITLTLPTAVGGQEPAILPLVATSFGVFTGDIIQQVGSRRYRAQASGEIRTGKLVGYTPAEPGEIAITATDSAGNGYFVIKLTNHKAVLIQNAAIGVTHEFIPGSVVGWTFGNAIANVSVKITNA